MPQSNLKEIFLWMFRRRSRHKVQGESMEPVLKNGQDVLVQRKKAVVTGDIAVVKHPYKKINLIKKVKSKDEDGNVEVEGLNDSESTDSRSFGKISSHQVLGKVTSIL